MPDEHKLGVSEALYRRLDAEQRQFERECEVLPELIGVLREFVEAYRSDEFEDKVSGVFEMACSVLEKVEQ